MRPRTAASGESFRLIVEARDLDDFSPKLGWGSRLRIFDEEDGSPRVSLPQGGELKELTSPILCAIVLTNLRMGFLSPF